MNHYIIKIPYTFNKVVEVFTEDIDDVNFDQEWEELGLPENEKPEPDKVYLIEDCEPVESPVEEWSIWHIKENVVWKSMYGTAKVYIFPNPTTFTSTIMLDSRCEYQLGQYDTLDEARRVCRKKMLQVCQSEEMEYEIQ